MNDEAMRRNAARGSNGVTDTSSSISKPQLPRRKWSRANTRLDAYIFWCGLRMDIAPLRIMTKHNVFSQPQAFARVVGGASQTITASIDYSQGLPWAIHLASMKLMGPF